MHSLETPGAEPGTYYSLKRISYQTAMHLGPQHACLYTPRPPICNDLSSSSHQQQAATGGRISGVFASHHFCAAGKEEYSDLIRKIMRDRCAWNAHA